MIVEEKAVWLTVAVIPLKRFVTFHLNKYKRTKVAFWKVWLQLAQWFCRRFSNASDVLRDFLIN